MSTSIEDKAYALGIIARELKIDIDDLSPDQYKQLDEIAEDTLLDEPKTELGGNIKKLIAEEKANSESEYNASFNFQKDLNNNKIRPITVFLFEVIGKYASRLVENDETVQGEILSEIIVKMNELGYPTGYLDTPFTSLLATVTNLNKSIRGQLMDREEELKALSVGIKHPKYNTLSPHIASFKQFDEAIAKLRETFNFTEEDYRGKKE